VQQSIAIALSQELQLVRGPICHLTGLDHCDTQIPNQEDFLLVRSLDNRICQHIYLLALALLNARVQERWVMQQVPKGLQK